MRMQIGMDGVVSATIQGENEPRNIGQIQITNFINPAGLNSIGRNLYTSSPASGEPVVSTPGENGTGQLGQGELESSNVNIVEEMVTMITGQRAYELNSKAIQTSDQMLQKLGQM